MNKDFTIGGIRFHLNENENIFISRLQSKYSIDYASSFGWVTIGFADTKRDAMRIAREWLSL